MVGLGQGSQKTVIDTDHLGNWYEVTTPQNLAMKGFRGGGVGWGMRGGWHWGHCQRD
jgi:hypothetical protein